MVKPMLQEVFRSSDCLRGIKSHDLCIIDSLERMLEGVAVVDGDMELLVVSVYETLSFHSRRSDAPDLNCSGSVRSSRSTGTEVRSCRKLTGGTTVNN
jgi:hypothetical protein